MHTLDHAIEVLKEKLVDANIRYARRPNDKHQDAVDSFTLAIEVLTAKRDEA